MELRNLRTFMVVSEQLNLSKAAEQLGYTQPTVTIQIKALEEELGHSLISRSGNKTFLTPAGKLLKKHGERIFTQLQEMKEDLNKLDKFQGNLVIASPEFYCAHYLYLIMRDYVSRYPQVNIKLVSCNSVEAIKMVHDKKADIGIVGVEYQLPGIESVIIDKEALLFVASTELLKKLGVSHVLEHSPILIDKNLEAISEKLFEEMNYSPPSLIECSSEETIKRSVLNQIGVCLLGSATVEKEIKDGTLTVLHRFSRELNTSIVYRKSREKEWPIQTFSSLVKETWNSISR
ncbi:LysR family transcriptional regulator [Bacillus sp. PK3_68]|uniref:LysR family transcriptional regulator n=1 Tax=Bacillaceae TaxID=186817 RepID=UPI000E724662|nr:LysR family transcriptional regulator [Bacillus sp. PK3_68]RJS60653.1 hypothetical protein CJ483_11680 [Bacillus sp. PK3_68]